MNEIKCPNCGQVFTVDEAGFAAILSQVRTSEFDAEIAQRSKELQDHLLKEHEQDTEIRLNQIRNAKDEEINILKMDIEKLKADIEKNTQQHSLEMNQSLTDKEMEISGLKQQIDGIKESQELVIANEIAKAVQPKDEQISSLKMDIEKLKADIEKNTQQHSLEMNQSLTDKEMEIYGLKQQIDSIKGSQELVIANEIAKAVQPKDEQISKLSMELQSNAVKQELAIRDAVDKVTYEREKQKAEYEAELKKQRELVAYYKDYKLRRPTKMNGEDLEQHCEQEFRKIQGYFPPGRVTFGKDNTVINNSKGDFIYRELDEYGNELLSIMFEMKNEMDTTKTKQKNEKFLKELDKDRHLKNCEYAVLVSMLEAENDYYNQGIVVPLDGQFEKMYIVRPEFFLTIISILRNAALNVTEYKKRAADLEKQNIDIMHFERELTNFKDGFLTSYNHAKKNFDDAIKEIDDTIKKLESVKKHLQTAGDKLGTANGKLEKISVKKLAKDSPSLLAITQNEEQ